MESKFLSLEYNEELDTLYCIWSNETKEAIWDEIKAEMFRYLETEEKHSPKAVLIDERKMLYPWHLEDQKWVAENISPKMSNRKLKKLALIMSEDIIVQISTDQLFDEIDTQGAVTKYFSTMEEAEIWIRK